MIHRLFFLCCLLFLCLSTHTTFATSLKSARIGNHETYSRIVLRFSRPLSSVVVQKKQGKQIIFELKGYKILLKKPALTPLKQLGPVKGYSLVKKKGKTLLVIQLSQSATLKRFYDLPRKGKKPYRLVIDIHKDPQNTPERSPKNKKKSGKKSQIIKEILVVSDTLKANDTIETLSSRLQGGEDPDDDEGLDPQISECPGDFKDPLKILDPLSLEKAALPLPNLGSFSEKPVIVIDPGHGGADIGTRGSHKTYEKDLALAYGQKLQRALNKTGLYTAMLTRTSDVFVPLRDRFDRAQKVGAHVFISIHVDHSPKTKLKGLSVYILSEHACDAEAKQLAEKENNVGDIPGLAQYEDCPMSSQDIIQSSQKQSKKDAVVLQNYVESFLPQEHHHTVSLKRSADLAVLKAPNIPSILVELGYLSNADDEKKLLEKDYQNIFVNVMLKAIDAYFESKRAV